MLVYHYVFLTYFFLLEALVTSRPDNKSLIGARFTSPFSMLLQIQCHLKHVRSESNGFAGQTGGLDCQKPKTQSSMGKISIFGKLKRAGN